MRRKKNGADQKRSGIEEIYSEKDILLQEINHLCQEMGNKISSRKRKTPRSNKL
nr:unnamed protein product [Callosobruchus chinensis]